MPNTLADALVGNPFYRQSDDNPIINGSFNIWQRNITFPGTVLNNAGSLSYTADRWYYVNTSAARHTVSRGGSATVLPPGTFSPLNAYHFDVSCTTINAAAAAGDLTLIGTRIEGHNFANIAQKPFVLSFWVWSSTAGISCVSLKNSAADRCYIAEFTINNANTWEYKEIFVPASPSTGTWNYTNGMGLAVQWTLMAGTTYNGGTNNTWNVANVSSTVNQVNHCATLTGAFRLNSVRITPGKKASPFIIPDFNYELGQCQRYYEKSVDYSNPTVPPNANTGNAWGVFNGAVGPGVYILTAKCVTRKRISGGTARVMSWTGAINQVSNGSGVDQGAATGTPVGAIVRDTEVPIQNSSAGNATPSSGLFLFHWDLDCEL